MPSMLFSALVTFLSLSLIVNVKAFNAISSSLRFNLIGKNRVYHGTRTALDMSIYSSKQGVPTSVVEERGACGVGFVASRSNDASHSIVKQALVALGCMEHRGASSADNISGDGAGILSAIPWELLKNQMKYDNSNNADGSNAISVAMVFLSRDAVLAQKSIDAFNKYAAARGFDVLGWRKVPVDSSVLGVMSAAFVPDIQQVLLAPLPTLADSAQLENRLYELRREIQGFFRTEDTDSHICSISSKTIVYKGMLRSVDLSRFYLDLQNPLYKSSFCVYHRRFSTNTTPKWPLAQPMRLLAHNGEINTLLGNINWVKSRERSIATDVESSVAPLVDVGRSDSANLDSILENYVRAGKSPQEALMILVPEAYANNPKLIGNTALQAFYEYYESVQESWDGPALLVFSDGEYIGAALDRNGLRPARFMVTADKEGKETVHLMSEVGVTKKLVQFADQMAQRSASGDGELAAAVMSADETLVESGRLGPGEMISLNIKSGELLLDKELKNSIAGLKPYKTWVDGSISTLPHASFSADIQDFVHTCAPAALKAQVTARVKDAASLETDTAAIVEEDAAETKSLIEAQTFFGWGVEDVEVQLSSMAADGVEATFCMGDDAPLAALSASPHPLYDYFKQRFAQVTNPPIDPLREGAVMSLNMFLGPRGDAVSAAGPADKRIKIDSPVLNTNELANLASIAGSQMKTFSTLYSINQALTKGGLKQKLEALCDAAETAVRGGVTIVNLSDKLSDAASAEFLSQKDSYSGATYVPPLLAVAAVHHRLISVGLRTKASLVVTTGQAWSTHHFACLVGYGASAVVPYAAFNAIVNWHGLKRTQVAIQRGDLPNLTIAKAMYNYRKSVDKGLLKILSKMGISLLTSYHGAQIFEAIGLSDEVVGASFSGTPCRVSGLTYDDIAAEVVEFSRRAYGDALFEGIVEKIEGTDSAADGETASKKLFNYGFLNFFKTGEYHHNNQPLIKTLHSAIRTHNLDLYRLYEESVTSRPPTTLRDALAFVPRHSGDGSGSGGVSVPLESVESVESIMQRFCSGGMSLGALSREAHETLAIAMNRIGGKSNSGEGGEDPMRFKPLNDVDADGNSAKFPHLKGLRNGDIATSRIKQVASGRFGVTPQYLMVADQLEIKVAQGAKPGEGGQLPAAKIDAYIAGLRKSKPGVTLISPPPHHDIYSIEDLAQLIYDLHQINPKAGVSVKLVSEVGIGTVASGVAKAGADIIQISGHDGGTGASPVSSIKHAGSPWELGLIESHSTLVRNGLRDRVLLRVDGGLKSGWDVVMAAAMGAEEFGFGTIAMVAEGCIMARICHTNKCPVGITTQNEALRKRFPGTPDNIVTFFGYVAEEVRHILAKLGYTSLDQIIGRVGLLKQRGDLSLKKTENLDLSFLLDTLEGAARTNNEDRSWLKHGPVYSNGITFDDKLLEDSDVSRVINANSGEVTKQYRICNTDRSSFARVSGVIAAKYGDNNFQGKLRFELTGAAGQSFGAFMGHGMDVHLTGYANDYVGKGMAGGRLVVVPPVTDDAACRQSGRCLLNSQPKFNVVGNTLLYGATGGRLYVRGRAGERFAVRNSGVLAVVEGLGDHGCEYMTDGVVICLGRTGRNFGAGMTGGLAFVLDDEDFLDGLSGDDLSSTVSGSAPPPFSAMLNGETVSIQSLGPQNIAAKEFLRAALTDFVVSTNSNRAQTILDNLDTVLPKFSVVVPASEKKNAILAQVTSDASVTTTTFVKS